MARLRLAGRVGKRHFMAWNSHGLRQGLHQRSSKFEFDLYSSESVQVRDLLIVGQSSLQFLVLTDTSLHCLPIESTPTGDEFDCQLTVALRDDSLSPSYQHTYSFLVGLLNRAILFSSPRIFPLSLFILPLSCPFPTLPFLEEISFNLQNSF